MDCNREQIVKALVCCTRGRKSKNDRPCLDCPYNECNIVGGTSERQILGTCQGWLMKDAIALIRELTEENESLEAENEHLDLVVEGKLKRIQSLERIVMKLTDKVASIKAKTVHKMHSEIKERCIKGGIYPAFVARTIENVAKEMLEGEI